MAYVGTRKLFEDAGFEMAATTEATSAGFPRVVMRRGGVTAVRHDSPAAPPNRSASASLIPFVK